MISKEDLTGILDALLPGIVIGALDHVKMGWTNEIYVVNGEYVVKVPRNPENSASLRKEVALTSLLRDLVAFPVPEYVSQTFEPRAAAVYRRIRGDVLTTHGFMGEASISPQTLTPDQREVSALQIADIINSIHGIVDLKVVGLLHQIGERNWSEQISSKVMVSKQIAEKHFTGDFLEKSLGALDGLERALKRHDYRHCFIHGDFGGWNLLYDHNTACITGVLDWEDACMGDPASDFADLIYDFGEDYAAKIFDNYAHEKDENMVERAELYILLNGFRDYEYGVANKVQSLEEGGFASIRKLVDTYLL